MKIVVNEVRTKEDGGTFFLSILPSMWIRILNLKLNWRISGIFTSSMIGRMKKYKSGMRTIDVNKNIRLSKWIELIFIKCQNKCNKRTNIDKLCQFIGFILIIYPNLSNQRQTIEANCFRTKTQIQLSKIIQTKPNSDLNKCHARNEFLTFVIYIFTFRNVKLRKIALKISISDLNS